MRTSFLIALAICFTCSFDVSVAQSSKKKTESDQKESTTEKSNEPQDLQALFARNAAIARGEDPDKIKPTPKTNAGSSKKTGVIGRLGSGSSTKKGGIGMLGGGNNGLNLVSAEEKKAKAKKQYTEIFSSKKTYEVRLRNKALALRKGSFMGMANKNTFAIFESKRQIVAVPADKLHKKLAAKLEGQIEKAKKVLTDTGVGFDDVHEIPDSAEEKSVGLAGREKIKMFVFNKPKEDPKAKKKDGSKDKTAKESSSTESPKSAQKDS